MRTRPSNRASTPPRCRFAPTLKFASALALSALALSAATGAAAQPVTNSPALVSPASPALLPGKMVFAALVTPDLLSAERFYTGLFGWQFQNSYLGDALFGQAAYNGRTIAAVVQKPIEAGRRPSWRSFLSTDNVEATVQLAVQNGAKVLVAPHQLGNLGHDALLADPQGAVFGLLTSSSGDPADILAAPGEWIWSTLVTTDPEADAAFYKTLLGYNTFDVPAPNGSEHVVLGSETYARASVNPMPSDHPVTRPRWISYVRVTDMATTVNQATTLGATVIVPPHEDHDGGTIALLADPAGALFGLLQWADNPDSAAATGDVK